MFDILTKFKVADNSGSKLAECIKLYSGSRFNIGSIILVNIKQVKHQKRIKKGTLYKAIVIRNSKKKDSQSGQFLTFSENAVVLLNPKKELIGTRVFGPIANCLRKKPFLKLLSLATNIV